MTQLDTLTPTRRQCRCGVTVWRVFTFYNVDVDPAPADARATGPFFERIGDALAHRPWPSRGLPPLVDPVGVIHAVHHCLPPHICGWCAQTHKPPTVIAGGFNNSSNSEKGTAA